MKITSTSSMNTENSIKEKAEEKDLLFQTQTAIYN